MAESEEELKSLLMKVKEESEKAGLKLNIKKAKIMEYSAITSWQIDGGKAETMADFIFLGSKITAGGYCSHEIKRFLLGNLGRKDFFFSLEEKLWQTSLLQPRELLCPWDSPGKNTGVGCHFLL